MSQPLVFMRSVCKKYRHERATIDALREVSLEVPEGEFVRLSGPSGSGKTTLLNLIADLIDPTKEKLLSQGRISRSSQGAGHRSTGQSRSA